MGNVIGIVAEYNPFHNGHTRLIEQTRARLLDEPRMSVVKRVILSNNADDIAHFCTFFRKTLAFSNEMITIRVLCIIIL